MEKIAEYERGQRVSGAPGVGERGWRASPASAQAPLLSLGQDGLQEKNPVRNFLDDPRRSGAFSEAGRREGSRRHVRNWGGADFDKVKTGLEPDKEPSSVVRLRRGVCMWGSRWGR